MKFKEKYLDIEYTLEEFVQKELDGNDYGIGSIEALEQTGENVVNAFTRLLKIMSEQDVLTQSDIEMIVRGYK